LAKPLYEIGSRLLRVDRGFMQRQFLEDQFFTSISQRCPQKIDKEPKLYGSPVYVQIKV